MIGQQIVVTAGAHVTLCLVNADTDISHGVAVAAPGAAGARMAMMGDAAA